MRGLEKLGRSVHLARELAALERVIAHIFPEKVWTPSWGPIAVRFGRWSLGGWTFVPVGLPDDDEIEPVLDFDRDSAELLA